MTVKEFAEKHPDMLLNMMTPCGYLTIMADELLQANKVRTNPGAAGADMTFEASEILAMKVVDFYSVGAEKTQSGKGEIRMLTDNAKAQ